MYYLIELSNVYVMIMSIHYITPLIEIIKTIVKDNRIAIILQLSYYQITILSYYYYNIIIIQYNQIITVIEFLL
jgi:hypothetical protein